MPYFKNKSKSGFTLVEILIVTAISLVVGGMILRIYISSSNIWDENVLQADLQARARNALNFMVNELRNATRTSTQNPSPNLSIPSTPNNKSIHFHLPEDKDGNSYITDADGDLEWDTNDSIDYQYVPGQKILRRLEKGEQVILANNVSDVQFIDAGIDSSLYLDELKIILTLQKSTPKQRSVSVTLTAMVNLRN
jgi:prepilin-type N-terminal cleavage/methylation domain-containing protein